MNTSRFIDIIKPLYDKFLSVKNINVIADFCYVGINFTRYLQNFTSMYELKNTILMTLRPILYEYILLQKFLELNPNNIDEFNQLLNKSGHFYDEILQNNINIFSNKVKLDQSINNLSLFLTQYNTLSGSTYNSNKIISNMIKVQNNNKYLGDKYDDSILSNAMINLFEETNGVKTFNSFIELINDSKNYNTTIASLNKIFINNQITKIFSPDYEIFMQSIFGPFSPFLWDIFPDDYHDPTELFLKDLTVYSLKKSKLIDTYSQNKQWFSNQLLKDIF